MLITAGLPFYCDLKQAGEGKLHFPDPDVLGGVDRRAVGVCGEVLMNSILDRQAEVRRGADSLRSKRRRRPSSPASPT